MKSRELLSKDEKLSAVILKVENLLKLGFLCTFKSSAKLIKELFADKPCSQKLCIEKVADLLLFFISGKLPTFLIYFVFF